ncbi:MAG: class II aldolase/adducin family protein [Gammaproteobacteria bacterium]|nr:class II aldolase/adducin family protein [Gammaproteobacteria bacterium]
MPDKNYIISEITKYSQKLDAKGFVANHDGNISALYGDTILATPTAVSKGNITQDMIITLDKNGAKIAGTGKPFSEIKLHLAAYRSRPDAKAVLHAHPPISTARGLTNQPLYVNKIPEAVVSIGDYIPVCDFAMPGTKESEETLAQALQQSDIVLIPGNGIISIGCSVEVAYLRVELVEHLAKIEFYANQLGAPRQLDQSDMDKLLAKRASIGLGPQAQSKPKATTSSSNNDDLKIIIAAEIKKVLGGQV